jgi:regulation of enolase protein 1 (concanavalin A-like superfamily)
MEGAMSWPLSQDYNEAIQNPAQSFADAELRQGEAETNDLGLPAPRSGNFADVYAVVSGPRKWAVKCFTRQIPGLQERYQQISVHLAQVKLPFMVDFTFLERGIRVRGDWYPVLKMQWVDGLTLNQFLKSNLDKPRVLDLLCRLWMKLAARLREANIAHCDLQHGNVLLVPGGKTGTLSVKLVDYDGMCVPSLTLLKSIEVGHPAYQHPQRQREGIYNLEVDRFSHLVIFTALRALMLEGRALWKQHDDGDNLLFKRGDFLAPARSPLLERLRTMGDEEVRKLAQAIEQSLSGPLNQVPLLDNLAALEPAASAEPRTAATALVAKRKAPTASKEADAFGPSADFTEPGLLSLVSAARRSRRAAQKKPPVDKRLIFAGVGGAALLIILLLFLALRGGSRPATVPILAEEKAKRVEKKDATKVLSPTSSIAPTKHKPEPQPPIQSAPELKPNQDADRQPDPIRVTTPKSPAKPDPEPPWGSLEPRPLSDSPKTVVEAQMGPLERKAVTLQYKFEAQPVRTVHLHANLKRSEVAGTKRAFFTQHVETDLDESVKPGSKGAQYHLLIGSIKGLAEANGKKMTLRPELEKLFRGPNWRSIDFDVFTQGQVDERRSARLVGGAVPADLHKDFDILIAQVANAYELACVSVPAGRILPGASWQAKLPALLIFTDKKAMSDVFAQCTYEGIRLCQGQQQAQLAVHGTVRERAGNNALGRYTGKLLFSVAGGFICRAEVKVEGDETLEVHLNRMDQSAPAVSSGKKAPGWGDLVDPDRDCEMTVEKDKLRITVPGTPHDFSAELKRMNAPHTLLPVQGDFIIDVKACGRLQPGTRGTIRGRKPYHGLGLLVFKDQGTYLRLDRGSVDQGSHVGHFASFEQRKDGARQDAFSGNLSEMQDIYLRLARRGNEFRALVSRDGTHWQPLSRSMVVDLPQEVRVGVLAINSSDQQLEGTFEGFAVRTGPGLDELGPTADVRSRE